MTESDLRMRPEFRSLPIIDEADEPGCQTLLRPYDARYDGTIEEAEDDVRFWRLLEDRQYEIRGAIRYSASDVRAIFWKKRD
jgi:hypothetical protein